MITTQLQLRRDTTANIEAITPAQGELIADLTRLALVLGDGSQAGGHTITPFYGTWTPTIYGNATAGTQTYSVQSGWWCKIGKLCVLAGTITLTANSGGSGTAYISGTLPAALNIQSSVPVGGAFFSTLGGLTHLSGFTEFRLAVVGSSSPVLVLQESGSAEGNAYTPITNVGAAATLTFMAIYLGAADNS